MDKKELSQFFADTIRTRELDDEQVQAVQNVLFPGFGDTENAKLTDSAFTMAVELERWKKKQNGKGQEHHDHAKPEPMSDAEIEALAALM